MLGVDKTQNLQVLMSRKEKLLTLSRMKLESIKNKETQAIQIEFEKEYETEAENLKKKLQKEWEQAFQRK